MTDYETDQLTDNEKEALQAHLDNLILEIEFEKEGLRESPDLIEQALAAKDGVKMFWWSIIYKYQFGEMFGRMEIVIGLTEDVMHEVKDNEEWHNTMYQNGANAVKDNLFNATQEQLQVAHDEYMRYEAELAAEAATEAAEGTND